MSKAPKDLNDPKGLIRESYNIEGIKLEECRSIFIDWALSLDDNTKPRDAIEGLLETYGMPGHPMTEVLTDGLTEITAPRGRKGGWRARPRD